MKKAVLAVILILCTCLCVWGQSSSPIDLILLLDTSSAMSSSYENVNNYLSGAFLKEFLRLGDTFHLIAFSGSSGLDSARRIQGQGDVETIIARMFLQYPVERTSNVSSAISFTEQYVTTLPNRAKKIVLITTGANDTNNVVSSARARLRSNITIDYIQVTPGQPLTNLPSSGRAAITTTSTGTTSRTTTTVTTTTGTTGTTTIGTTTTGTTTTGTTTTSTTSSSTSTSTTATGKTTTTGTTTTGTTATETSATGITSTGTTTTTSTASTDTTTTGTAATGTTATGTTATGTTTDTATTGTTATGTIATGTASSGTSSDADKGFVTSLWFIILIIIFSLLLLALIIFLLSRRSGSGPQRAISEASSVVAASSDSAPVYSEQQDTTKPDDRLSAYATAQSRRTTPYDDRANNKPVVINPSGPLLLNLFVNDQNTLIGKRNIHSLKSGYKLTVGGGKNDDFLIFLVPMPAHIGEIKRNGSQLTFIPKKAKYFPEIGSNEVNDCINKSIRIVSDKGYDMRFRFEMYEDPLISLNRMLMSVRVPG